MAFQESRRNDSGVPIGTRAAALLVLVSIAPAGFSQTTRPESAPSGWTFVNLAASAGLVEPIRSGTERQEFIPEVKGLGVALIDYDGDGRDDIFLVGGSTVERMKAGQPGFGCRLYRNETEGPGKLRFRDVTAAAKLPEFAWAAGPAVADWDGDGRPDILVTGFAGNVMLRNAGDGTFEDVTKRAGLVDPRWSTGAAFGDLDNDGDLDVYVAHYLKFDVLDPPVHGKGGRSCLFKSKVVMCGPRGLQAEPDRAYRNRGDGTFEDATAAWGFDKVEPRYGLGVLIADFDRDGREDVFVANDSCPNFLFVNTGKGFDERAFEWGVAYNVDGSERAGMGVDAADLNGDGFQDLIVTAFSTESNPLYVSVGKGRYMDMCTAAGIATASYPWVGWGTGFVDFDNDGDQDLFVANGHVYTVADGPGTGTSYRQRNQVFRNDGRGHFTDVSALLGPGLQEAHVGRGAAFGDLDGDGAVDVVVVNLNEPPSVLRNQLPSVNHWVTLRLREDGPNRDAIGAFVTLEAGGRKQTREVRRNASFQASNDPRLHFGLGAAASIGSLEVRWPDGTVERFAPPAIDRPSDVVKGSGLK